MADIVFLIYEPALVADWTREPAGDVKTFQKIKFTPEVSLGFEPCPPVIGDYTPIVGAPGSNPCTPLECQLDTLYSTDYHYDGLSKDSVVFKCQLIAGTTYRVALETSVTQPLLSNSQASLMYWQPSDWPGLINIPFGPYLETYEDDYDEDVEPYWCPYPYKLNEEDIYGDWVGGRRYEFTPTETGEHVFMFFVEYLI